MIRQEHRTVLIQMAVIILLVLSDVTFTHQCLPRLVNVNQPPITLSPQHEMIKIEFLDVKSNKPKPHLN